MKKTNRIISLIALVLMLALSLTACVSGGVGSSGTATIVIEGADGSYTTYDVDLSKLEKRDEGVISLLEYVASMEGSTLYYNVQWGGGYGAYITSIDTLTPNPMNQYIAIYTTEKEDFAVPTEWTPTVPTVKYGEITLTYTGVGLSSMHVKDGTVILFRLEGF